MSSYRTPYSWVSWDISYMPLFVGVGHFRRGPAAGQHHSTWQKKDGALQGQNDACKGSPSKCSIDDSIDDSSRDTRVQL